MINRLKYEIQEGRLVQSEEMQDLEKVIDDFTEKHRPISDYFFTGYGNTLQNRDSHIAEQIMLDFAKDDIPVLPVHDSFIIEWEYAPLLEVKMLSAPT